MGLTWTAQAPEPRLPAGRVMRLARPLRTEESYREPQPHAPAPESPRTPREKGPVRFAE